MKTTKMLSGIRGDVHLDDHTLNFYSVDSSFYKVKPKLVVVPKTISDIVKAMQFARTNRLSITPRGGGTGLVGSALNDGMIIDLRNFDSIRVYQNHISVGAGVYRGRLDNILERRKKFLGPNPSVGPYCTVGGMIGTNASGTRSLKYGSIIDNLLEVTIVTSSGRILKLPSRTSLAKSVLHYANMADKSTFPKVSKNSCGYRLDSVTNISQTQKVIAGSEGTLGIIIAAKLRVFDIPKNRLLLIMGYKSVEKAVEECKDIVSLRPSALEFVDYATMKNIKTRFPQKIRCLLFAEFDVNVRRNFAELKNISSGTILYELDDKKSIEQWWGYRNAALHFSLKNILSEEAVPHIIEDAAVPLEKLKDLVQLAENIRKKYKAKLVMYGHAGNGNLHMRLASRIRDSKTVNRLAKEFFSQVIAMGGTITGEHGDGIARSKFVKMQYGRRTHTLFSQLKREFDPMNILNPHKIVPTQKTTGTLPRRF